MASKKEVGVDKPLNEKQLKFCEAYLRTGEIRGSLIEAGFSPTYGNQIFRCNGVIAYLRSRKSQEIKTLTVDQKRLITEIEEIKEKAKAEEKTSVQLRAIELQAKILGLIEKDKKATPPI